MIIWPAGAGRKLTMRNPGHTDVRTSLERRESAANRGVGMRATFRPDLAGAAARDFEAGLYLQDLLVAAVVAILLTRAFLGLTGYPRVGGGGLHVAHMLWGGLLMLAALVLLLAVLGKRTKRVAGVLGG